LIAVDSIEHDLLLLSLLLLLCCFWKVEDENVEVITAVLFKSIWAMIYSLAIAFNGGLTLGVDLLRRRRRRL